jgi:hypothetical protein
MGLTIEETLLTKEMMLVSFLQILSICCMNFMNLLIFPHKFSKCFFGVSPRHHGGRLSFIRSLEVPLEFLDLKNVETSIGAIKLNREQSLLVTQALRNNS